MALSLKFTNDAFPPGTEFHLEGVGLVINGEEQELTEEQEHGFIATNRVTIQDSTANSEMYEISGDALVGSVADSLGIDPAEISDVAPVLVVEQPVVDETVEQPVTTEEPQTVELGGDV